MSIIIFSNVFFFSFWFFSTEDENLPSNFPQYMHVKNVWTLLNKISHFWGPWLSNPMLTNKGIFSPNLLMWTNLNSHLFYWLASSTDRPLNTCWTVSWETIALSGIFITVYCHGEVYSTQHYVIKFVSDLRHFSGFLYVFRFPPPCFIFLTFFILNGDKSSLCWQ